LFQNLRASRETALANDFPLHFVTAWLGNSPAVAARHYLQVTDEHFKRVAQGGTACGDAANRNKLKTGEGVPAPVPPFPGKSENDLLAIGSECPLKDSNLEPID
jgi:hypothetical protein